jgi:hypothetical protein
LFYFAAKLPAIVDADQAAPSARGRRGSVRPGSRDTGAAGRFDRVRPARAFRKNPRAGKAFRRHAHSLTQINCPVVALPMIEAKAT